VRVLPLVSDPFALKNYPSPNRHIIVFGDGLVEGVGVAPSDRMTAWLSRLIKAPIYNAGVAGDTTERALKRLDSDVLAYDPQVVCLLLGAEDIINRVPRTNTVANLRTIITRLQAGGAVVIFVGLKGNPSTLALAEDCRALALATGSVYVPDILGDIIDDPFLMNVLAYPGPAGYRVMAQRILPALEKIYWPKPELRLLLTRQDTSLELRWPTLTNHAYRVLASTNLSATNWLNLAGIQGNGSPTNYLQAPVLPVRFFKIEETR
jgi:acyl-CoA thioesterase I